MHRGLGVHISRVKSLVLDKWEPELLMVRSRSSLSSPRATPPPNNHMCSIQSTDAITAAQLMKSIGNAMANSIWEFNASPALKPNESSDR